LSGNPGTPATPAHSIATTFFNKIGQKQTSPNAQQSSRSSVECPILVIRASLVRPGRAQSRRFGPYLNASTEGVALTDAVPQL